MALKKGIDKKWLWIGVVAAIIIIVAGGFFFYNGPSKEQSSSEGDFGCWPSSCSIIPDAQGKQSCEDWKAGKAIQWPPDCSSLSQSGCAKLCDLEKKSGKSLSPNTGNQSSGTQTTNPPAQNLQVFDTLPSLVDEEFTSDVTDGDKTFVVEGISAMDFYLNDWFGKSTDKPSGLRVDAIQSNDPSIGAQVVIENGKIVILLGTKAFAWNRQIQTNGEMGGGVEWRPKIPAHEYVHVYQFQNGCGYTGAEIAVTPKWFFEGEAEWLSIKVMREAGWLPQQFSTYDIEIVPSRQISGELKSLQGSVDKYPLFTLAIDYLMKDKDMKTLDNFCANIGKGQDASTAFQNAFGISLDEFYKNFESYRSTWSSDSSTSTQQPDCSTFESIPSCSYLTEAQGYTFCKQCYPNK